MTQTGPQRKAALRFIFTKSLFARLQTQPFFRDGNRAVAQPAQFRRAALLWTLEKGLGDGWTPEVADAWGTAYGTLSGYMISEAYGRSQAAE